MGVDHLMQPRYCGDYFCQADVLTFLRENTAWIQQHFALVTASPPCQRRTKAQKIQGREHPALIAPTRELLDIVGLPYVIENVEPDGEDDDPLHDPILLCGPMFGLHTYRHRLFEVSGFTLTPPEHPKHTAPTVKMGRPLQDGDFYHAVGNFSNVPYVRRDMGMSWATRDGLREAVPPAYARYIGQQFIAQTKELRP